jgi:hypothetical protein
VKKKNGSKVFFTRMRCDAQPQDLANVHLDWSKSELKLNSEFEMLSKMRRFFCVKKSWNILEFGAFVYCLHLCNCWIFFVSLLEKFEKWVLKEMNCMTRVVDNQIILHLTRFEMGFIYFIMGCSHQARFNRDLCPTN